MTADHPRIPTLVRPNVPTSVIFGAGSVGRGFLGQLFTESGYNVIFVDVDASLVAALADRGAYTLRLSGVVKVEDLVIAPVTAVDGRDADAVAAAVAGASLMATAVGARALQAIAGPMARGLVERFRDQAAAPLNIIICENLHDAPEQLRSFVAEAMSDEAWQRVAERVGFVPAVIARMSPVPTPEQREADVSLIVAEPYKVLPVDRDAFVGPLPSVVGMEAVSPFEAYTARKLYIHNAAHALLGYLGYQRGHAYGYEALDDPWVASRLASGLSESSRALIAEFGFEPVALREHIDYLLVRFANRALADPIDRLARDPLRKLSPDDRLVGAARLAERHGIRVDGMAWGIAAALAYEDPYDAHAVALRERIGTEGIEATLRSVCDIDAGEALGGLVLRRYRELATLSQRDV